MKTLLSILLVASGSFAPLEGHWSFFGFFYRGEEMAPLNPKLHIEMKFEEVGQVAWLKYWREDEEGFCERKAIYAIETNADSGRQILYQKVMWLNPNNRSDCGRDPDMRFGESWTPIEVTTDELRLILPLGEETITFRFSKSEAGFANAAVH